VTDRAGKFRRELNAMIFPRIQSDHEWADSSAAARNLREKAGALKKERRALLGQSCALAVRAGRCAALRYKAGGGPERNGDTLVAATSDWATGVSPFRLA